MAKNGLNPQRHDHVLVNFGSAVGPKSALRYSTQEHRPRLKEFVQTAVRAIDQRDVKPKKGQLLADLFKNECLLMKCVV